MRSSILYSCLIIQRGLVCRQVSAVSTQTERGVSHFLSFPGGMNGMENGGEQPSIPFIPSLSTLPCHLHEQCLFHNSPRNALNGPHQRPVSSPPAPTLPVPSIIQRPDHSIVTHLPPLLLPLRRDPPVHVVRERGLKLRPRKRVG